jgi:hypothetical protein
LLWGADIANGLSYCLPGYVGGIWKPTTCLIVPTAPYIDPPWGGYVYEGASIASPVADNRSWFWDEIYTDQYKVADPNSQTNPTYAQLDKSTCGTNFKNCTTLQFYDAPTVTNSVFQTLPLQVRFSTTLVGVYPAGTGDALNLAACNPNLIPNLQCVNISGTSFDWHAVGTQVGVIQYRQSASNSGTQVYSDGFKQPGAAGFTQPELELFARSGINIREDMGPTTPVIIDIKPGGFPNSINPQSLGKITVAIISTTEFQAPTQVDQHSLTFGRTGNESSLSACHSEDVNGDGILDLVCQFYTSMTAFQHGDTKGILKGKTLAGTPAFGTDSVVIVSP